MRMKIYSKLIERFKRTLELSDYILGQLSLESLWNNDSSQ